jgi:hypothetical protein
VSLVLQIVVIYVATSLTIGLLLAVGVGRLICRGDRRRKQEVRLLARSRARQRAGADRG